MITLLNIYNSHESPCFFFCAKKNALGVCHPPARTSDLTTDQVSSVTILSLPG